jgi:hypothetical protein
MDAVINSFKRSRWALLQLVACVLVACGGATGSDPSATATADSTSADASATTDAATSAATTEAYRGTSWTYCAPENGTCAFNGTQLVRFGAVGKYVTKTLTNGTACTVAVFGDPAPGKTKHCDTAPTSTTTSYTLSTSVTTGGAVASSPNGISCGGSNTACSSSFPSGTAVTLSPTAASGYSFTGWGGACSGTGTCSVTLTANTSVTANFATQAPPPSYTLKVTAGTGGQVTSSPTGISCGGSATACSASFTSGTAVNLTAVPASGYSFSGWSGACSGTGACSVSMSTNASVTANFAALPPQTYTVTLSPSTGGQVTSSPAGISCGGSGTACSATFTSGASVTLTATASTGYSFSGWSGACSGTSTTCALTVGANTTVGTAFSVIQVPSGGSGSPKVLYTDTLSAPTSGGENGLGGYLSIFGKNFGTSGLGTTTKVYIGSSEVANYRYLGTAKVGSKLGIQQITVQVGNLGGAAAGTALPVKVVVNGVASNTDQVFYPTSGRVLFVSQSGNDSTAVANDITHPWRYLQNASAYTGAYFAMKAGDQVVIRGGNWSDVNGVDGTWMRASLSPNNRNGTATAWIHITAYPGPVNGNAIEDVHYSTPAGQGGGIWGPWSGITGTSGNYWAVSNLRMDVNGQANADAAPINFQYVTGPWRVVNNELGPWPVANVTAAQAAGIAGQGAGMEILGNHIHNIAGTSALENHGIYIDTATSNWEIAYNWIHDITGGSILQFNDAVGGAGTYKLPDGSIWPGFNGMKVHHNWLENAAKYGITIADPGANAGSVQLQAWNNVIIGTQLPAIRMSSSALSFDVTFAYNTIYNAMTTNSGSGNGYFRNEWNGNSGAIRAYNNLLAIGANTVSGTTWFFDYSGKSSAWAFRNNLYWDNGRGLPAFTADPTRVVGDPKFTNVTTEDLTLQSGSPAIDKALQSTPMTVGDDFTALVPRPSGSANDIGAAEFKQ